MHCCQGHHLGTTTIFWELRANVGMPSPHVRKSFSISSCRKHALYIRTWRCISLCLVHWGLSCHRRKRSRQVLLAWLSSLSLKLVRALVFFLLLCTKSRKRNHAQRAKPLRLRTKRSGPLSLSLSLSPCLGCVLVLCLSGCGVWEINRLVYRTRRAPDCSIHEVHETFRQRYWCLVVIAYCTAKKIPHNDFPLDAPESNIK